MTLNISLFSLIALQVTMPGVQDARELIYQPDSTTTTTTTTCCSSGPTRVLDYLYLGSSEDASNYGVLRELGVTHLLNCAGDMHETQRCALTRFAGNTGILEHVGFDADDSYNYNILQHLPYSVTFITRAKQRGKKVLVYCVKGINRSAAVCIGYLMQVYGLLFDEALCKVKESRPGILTNPGFVEQLQSFSPETRNS